MGKKILFITFIGLVLRLINICQSFWLDEAAQLVMSQQSLSWIWFDRVGDFHPPLFYFLTHFWLSISHSEIILRALPVISGLLAIPAIYLLTSKLFSNKIAIYAALFTAVNPYLVYYSQEMRSYSLMLFLSVLSMNYLVRKQWFWLISVNILLFYTHYSSSLFVLAQLTFIIFYSHRYIKTYLFTLLSSFVLYLPWLPQFFRQLNSGINIDQYLPGWRAELTLPLFKSFPLILFKFTAGRIDLEPNYIYLVYIIFVILSVFIILYLSRKSYPILTIWLVLPVFTSLILSIVIPQTQPFRLIFCLPPLLIYFALAAHYHPRKVLTILVYVFVIGNFMQITRPRLLREQWRQVTEYLNSENIPVIVKFSDKFAPLTWYKLVPKTISAFPLFVMEESKEVMVMEYLTDLTDPKRKTELQLITLGYKEVYAQDFPGVGIIRKYVFSR